MGDATATAEVNAIRAATRRLETHNLSGCDIYCTVHPDLMSLGAILWARIDNVYCGVTQQVAAQSGFEEGIIHFKDLIETTDNERKITDVVEGVAKDDCEKVFQEWSDRNGVLGRACRRAAAHRSAPPPIGPPPLPPSLLEL